MKYRNILFLLVLLPTFAHADFIYDVNYDTPTIQAFISFERPSLDPYGSPNPGQVIDSSFTCTTCDQQLTYTFGFTWVSDGGPMSNFYCGSLGACAQLKWVISANPQGITGGGGTGWFAFSGTPFLSEGSFADNSGALSINITDPPSSTLPSPAPSPVPEPASLSLLAGGSMTMLLGIRRMVINSRAPKATY